MQRVRVEGFTISADGFGAGPNQSLESPLGVAGEGLHQWLVTTRTFKGLHGGGNDGSAGIDDDSWQGWWGDDPPYHTPVYVLTSHPRPSIVMKGGTVFHFVTGGIQAALDQAFAAAGGKDVRIGGGVATVRQYLQARLVDEMHVAISPVLLGAGEHLFAGLDLPALGYACTSHAASDNAMHLVITKRA